MDIKTKQDMFELYEQGKFGNKFCTWSNIEEAIASGYIGEVSLRYKGNLPGKWAAYRLSFDAAQALIEDWVQAGAQRNLIVVNESAPDDMLLIQGEVMRSVNYLELHYSLEPGLKMREAMMRSQYATGLLANEILRSKLSPASFDDLNELLTIYDTSVVEFSVYSKCIGQCRQRNTVIWEVRTY